MSCWLAAANTFSGSPFSTRPPTRAAGFARMAASRAASQPGSGSQSSSVSASTRPRARAAATLRAAAGPPCGAITSSTAIVPVKRATTSVGGEPLPSSATITSKAPGG
jgi:hypothetical protein